jgi:putative spermidine/putrescine transport system permease protein
MMGATPRLLHVYVLCIAVLVLLPIVVIIPVSLNPSPSLGLPVGGVSLRWYISALSDRRLLHALELSILVALISTIVALSVGSCAAYAIARRDLRTLDLLFLAPIAFPGVVLGGALLFVLAPLGLVRTAPGLITAHVVVVLPYIVRTMVTAFRAIDPRLEEAAAILGATPWRMGRRILLPLALPGLISAAVFGFIISFDEFSVSLFLVGTNLMTTGNVSAHPVHH